MVNVEDYNNTVILFIVCILLLCLIAYILERRINKLYTIIKTLVIFGFQNEWIYLTLFGIPRELVFKGVEKQLMEQDNIDLKIPDYIRGE